MPAYRNVEGNSGIVSYQYGQDWIEVEFEHGPTHFYKYTSSSAGLAHIKQMKYLADSGKGLNTYINKNVAQKYAAKR